MLYRLLDHPRLYNLVQSVALMGGAPELRAAFEELTGDRPYRRVLELGCGTGGWTVGSWERYVRTDLHGRYFPAEPPAGMEFRILDATDLSDFGPHSFDLVYCTNMYHHLSDQEVISSLREAARVLAPDGKMVILDGILPRRPWDLAAWLIRKADRGRYMRTKEHNERLIVAAGMCLGRGRRCRYGPGLESCVVEAFPAGPEPEGGMP